ncbi:hypothetical protein [Winogradskyella schleiferi]|uniref:hypothetical protein n=1 Tax=Winogradskyella schleiferi TaxID=2686078 RepID=UPI0015BA24C3|nr:hypothetical protein [Winogradskyella schleiferi]
MKIQISHLLISFLFAFLCVTSCQDEIEQIENPNEQETIVPNSTLASLMSRTASNFGAADDILDGASCFSVELPVTIQVSDITIIIESEADLEALEDVLYDISVDEDVMEFVFPITIIFNDYSQIIIENANMLQSFIDECVEDENDVIACADFVYPISFSVFNSGFNLVDTVVISDDEALYIFLDELEDDENAVIVSLNFPVTIAYANGETIEVDTNEELAAAIEVADQFCEDENDCLEDEVAQNLIECSWAFSDGSGNFENDRMIFNPNGELQISEGMATSAIGGNWNLSATENGIILNFSELTAFQDSLGGDWLIIECDVDRMVLTKVNQTLVLEQDCEGNLGCSEEEINANIIECAWQLQTNLMDSLVPIYVYFTPNAQVLLSNNGNTETQIGTWDLVTVSTEKFIEFILQQGFETLNGQWQIVECNDGFLHLVIGNNYIYLEQECNLPNDDELFNCFGDFEILTCEQPNNAPVYNLSANTIGLIDCSASFTPSFHETLADANNNVNPISNTESYETLTAQVYLRIEAASGNFEIFNVYLNTENCNYFECFESFDAILEVCDNFTDGPYEFNLTIAFANCTPTADVVTYHETQADAEAAINPISNPEVYTSVNVMQIVYVRVEISNQYEVFPIQLSIIDCNAGNCTEGDIDGILAECLWNISSYNGSDNLFDYNFNFEQNSGIVVIYNDTITIDAGWSTSQANDGVVIAFSNVAGPNIQAINGNWLVVECTAEQLVLHNVNDSNNEIVLDRTCE